MELFITALVKKYRFKSASGFINMEQLCDLPTHDDDHPDTLIHLDGIYRFYENQVSRTKGLTGEKSNDEAFNKMEIVRAIFNAKRAMAEEAAMLKNNDALREELLEVAHKQHIKEITKGKSAKEVVKMAKKL